MLTLTAFIANAQPSAIAPRDYQQMLKKEIDVDWWGRSEKNKYGPIRKRQLRDLHSKVLSMQDSACIIIILQMRISRDCFRR